MRIFNLIKKDILLVGNYLFVSLLLAFALPIYLSHQSVYLGSVYLLLVSISFSCYFIFNNIFLAEDKYKGNLYLMSTPYTKWDIAITKYILALLLFGIELICYFFSSKIIHAVKPSLSFSAISIVFFLFSVVLSIFFPLYFRYSYAKIKMALLVIFIFLPTWGVVGVTYLLGRKSIADGSGLSVKASCLLIILGGIVLLLSAQYSNHILKKRDF
ncbi:MAG: ABC-2 transporter permease [Hespellia sp.]|nr:ABC-2 transporter permease [Hespellia sp.]